MEDGQSRLRKVCMNFTSKKAMELMVLFTLGHAMLPSRVRCAIRNKAFKENLCYTTQGDTVLQD